MTIYFFPFILFAIIVALGGVHGRTLYQRPIIAQMTQKGQIFDCIDFYKQPAFDHPLLKNQVPKARRNWTTSSIQGNKFKNGCPDGTVPILRPQFGERDRPPPRTRLPPAKVHCYAVVKTNTPNRKFYGSNALASVYKPAATGYQWSAARIKLANGPDSIVAGWMVFPDFFKDDEAHLYARFTAGRTECLNYNCPGFVQVAKDVPLGSTPQGYSNIGGRQVAMNISIDKHQNDGNWWLSVGSRQIGYWPSGLFTGLKDAAAEVEWGGEINNPGAVEPAPLMGCGWKASYDQRYSAYFMHITVVDESRKNVIPDGTKKFYDCPLLYTVLDWGNQGGDYGRLIFYGGSQTS